MNKLGLIEEFHRNQLEYQKKRGRMDAWKKDFQRLETEVKNVMESFEKHYQKSELTDDFPTEIKEKLENRREGIRLSVKSASRLLKKLAPEKPLNDVGRQFITKEELVDKIQFNREQCDQSSEEKLNTEETELLSIQNQSQESDHEESGTVSLIEEKNLGQEEEEKSEVQENPVMTEETGSENGQSDITILIETHQTNDEILKELEDHLETAENRFLKFIEKGVAPVFDGLYSGKNYANDLIEELEKSENEKLVQTKQWLTIYDELMKEVEQLFEHFSINLYIPEIGSLFDENTQEPIGVVEDDHFEDEQIKEVVRYGLIYEKEIFNQSSFLFRPAQVIVVKNKKQHAESSGEGNEQ